MIEVFLNYNLCLGSVILVTRQESELINQLVVVNFKQCTECMCKVCIKRCLQRLRYTYVLFSDAIKVHNLCVEPTGYGRNFKSWRLRPVLENLSRGFAISSSAAWPKLGRSAIEIFLYLLPKQASLGRVRQVPEPSFFENRSVVPTRWKCGLGIWNLEPILRSQVTTPALQIFTTPPVAQRVLKTKIFILLCKTL
jgi:hypothetical protein